MSILNALISNFFLVQIKPKCRYDKIYAPIVIVGFPMIFLLAITILYILIYRTLRKKIFKSRETFLKQIQRYFNEDDQEKLSKEVKTTILLLVTVTTAYLVLGPSYIYFAISRILPNVFSKSLYYLTVCIMLTQAIINPLLYAYCISNIRNRCKCILRRVFCCNKRNAKTGVESSENNTHSSGV